jgi:pyrroline-5-carboxylate reductase
MAGRTDKDDAVLLVGAGRMGGALLKGWLGAGRFGAVRVVEPHPSEALREIAGSGKISLTDRLEADQLENLVAAVVAVKPQILKADPSWLGPLGAAGPLVLSIAAGVPVRFFAAGLGPKARVVRAMPNTPGAIGRGITALYGADLSPADLALAEALMLPLGQTLWVREEAWMDIVTAVSGSGPAYVFLMVEALAAAGHAEGLDAATAERLARVMVSGAGALLDADPRAATELRREVTSPGGTTQAALDVLMAEKGLADLMRRAVAAARLRGQELGS